MGLSQIVYNGNNIDLLKEYPVLKKTMTINKIKSI